MSLSLSPGRRLGPRDPSLGVGRGGGVVGGVRLQGARGTTSCCAWAAWDPEGLRYHTRVGGLSSPLVTRCSESWECFLTPGVRGSRAQPGDPGSRDAVDTGSHLPGPGVRPSLQSLQSAGGSGRSHCGSPRLRCPSSCSSTQDRLPSKVGLRGHLLGVASGVSHRQASS